MDIALHDRGLAAGLHDALERESTRLGTAPGPAAGREALRWLLAHRGAFGITRVGDLTGLDRLGLPVMQACRPLARSNAVTQGKGRTRSQAALGAVMECLETWAGERIPEGMTAGRGVEDLTAAWHPAHAPPEPTGSGTPEVIRCLRGWDIGRRVEMDVPEALVSTDYTLTAPARASPLPRATTGLGAGVTLHGAILQGLRECIEREAFDRALRTHGLFEHCRVAAETVGDPVLRHWIRRGESVGVSSAIWQLETIAGQAGFWLRLLERDSPDQLLPLPSDGIAVDADPVVAVRKAYLEAAQGRVATISGAREDITRAHYPRYIDPRQMGAEHARMEPRADSVPFPARAGTAASPPASDLAKIVSALRQEHRTFPVVVPLATIREGRYRVHVVRVVVPGFAVVPGHGMGRAR